MPNLPWVMLRARSGLVGLAAGNAPLASERFRFVPRTFRPLFGRLIVRRSMRAVCAPEEIRHERAGCSGEPAFGF
jgi:hypothetical protein